MIFKNVSFSKKSPIAILAQNEQRWGASPFWLGIIFVVIAGLFVQLLLPFFFPHLFNTGVLKILKDPLMYHTLAVDVANAKWNSFSFFPNGLLPVGVFAFIYKITGIYHPVMILPLLGILAGLTMRGIASCLDVLGVHGRWWPLVLSILFTVTPTSLSWMIYPFKDAFIVPGIILIVWSLMVVTLKTVLFRHFVALLFGSILVFCNNVSLAPLFFFGSLLSIPFALLNSEDSRIRKGLFFLIALIVFGSTSVLDPNGKSLLLHPLSSVADAREKFLIEKSYGHTNFLPEVNVEGTWETIKFLPRALQLSLVEPLPWRDSEQGDTRTLLFSLVQLEMFLVYASLLFLILSGKKTFNVAVLTCLIISIPALLALGIAVPNIGVINRYRFPFLLLIKMAGLAALWNSSRFKWPGRLLMWADPAEVVRKKKKILFLVPDDVTFIIQRLVMAQGAQNAGYDVHVASEDSGASEKIKELGFTFHHLDLNRGGLNPFADFRPFIKLVFFLAKERPDILQCVSIKPVLYGATAGTIVGLKRIVCLINGLGYAFEGNDLKGKAIKKVAMALYRNALALPGIRVVFQNPDDRAYFVDNQLVDANKTLLIRGSGVNMKKFIPSAQPDNSSPIILFVGRLLWNKGIKELVEASRILKNEKLEFTLKIVGAPDERNPEAVPEAYLKSLHHEGIIDWVGRQTDMPKFYREADIVCLPTQYKEGLPLTLLEAAAIGRTLVATDVPGCREVVRTNVNGFLVQPNEVNELANVLRILIVDSDLRRKFGEASTKIVKEEFAAEIIQAQLVAVYGSLLNNVHGHNLTTVSSKQK
jgi:glycosyltransferase involved in cell wall biosynthesis